MSLVVTQKQGAIAKIRLNRPEKKNSLNQAMYQVLDEALKEAIADDEIKVIGLSGEGQSFTAGNDVADFANMETEPNIGATVNFMRTLLTCPKPVVASVQGMAIGIGTTMLLHCDLVIASKDATFAMPFVNLGLVPEYASSLVLPRLAGHQKAAEWLLLGETFGADEACQFGLVNKVVENDALTEQTDNWLAKLAAKPRQSLLQSKALMRPDVDNVMQHMELELDVFIEHLQSPAAKEAFAAFLEKRKPDPAKFQ